MTYDIGWDRWFITVDDTNWYTLPLRCDGADEELSARKKSKSPMEFGSTPLIIMAVAKVLKKQCLEISRRDYPGMEYGLIEREYRHIPGIKDIRF